MTSNPVELAAGGVVWRKTQSSIEILLAHRPAYGDWAFPKGKLSSGESLIECAAREVREETGLEVEIRTRLTDTAYTKPSGRPKRVAYWAMRQVSGDFTPNGEVDQIKWLKPGKAVKLLSYERDRDLVLQLPDKWTRQPRRLIVVRHAEAGVRDQGKSTDRTRPLSKIGRRQAAELVERLRSFRIDRILSSPAERCLETIQPLAEARSIEVVSEDDLWEEAGAKATQRLLRDLAKGTTLMCSHRPVVERILDAFAIERPNGAVSPKGSCWIIDLCAGHAADHHQLLPTS